jgi:cytochrome P450
MAFSYMLIGLASALTAYILFVVVSSILQSRRNAAVARELKCEEPPAQKNRLPFGIDQVRRSLKADREKIFPIDSLKRVEEVGAITFKYANLGSANIITADEKNVQAILATQFNDFCLGPIRRGNFFPLLGNGIFTQDGPAWSHSRSMMRPQFAREQVSDLNLEEEHVQNLMRHLVVRPDADGWTDRVDLQVLFFRLTIDSATEFLFGESVNSQLTSLPAYNNGSTSQSKPRANLFATAFDQSQMALATRSRLQTLYNLYNPLSFRQNCKECHDFIDHFVRLALRKDLREKELEKGIPSKKEKYVFLEALATQTQDPIELRSQLLNILLAGRDTTASLLGWLFFSLARDPARYAKLRAIILEDFGSYNRPKEITFARLKSCMYLQHCLSESLRLFPVVPFNSRMATKDTTLPRGGGPDGKARIFVPKGTQVDYSVHIMHHRKDVWGEDAEEWKPERWDGRKVGWEFLPVSPFLPYGPVSHFPFPITIRARPLAPPPPIY